MCAKRKATEKKKILFSDEFYSDMNVPEMLQAILVRSPFSNGTISSIDFSPKTKIPAGYTLFTAKDLGKNARVNILGTEIPLLCGGEIAYKGEPVALLLGEDKEILLELKNAIQIHLDKKNLRENELRFSNNYKNLSISLKDGSFLDQGITSLTKPQNFSYFKEIVAKRKILVGNVDEIFSNEENTVIEGNWENHIRYKSNKETEGCLSFLKGGNLHIFTPSQWISNLRDCVSIATGFPKEKIIITRTKISVKTTNSLWQNAIFACLTAIATIKAGKPIKLSLSRIEQEELIELPPKIEIKHKTALDKNGLITAMNISIKFYAGAYNPFAKDILDRLTIASTGIYNCKNVRISAEAYKTHTAPSSLHLSMIDSQAFFAIESQIQKIADITGFSPVDLRQKNKAGGLQKLTHPFTYSFGRSSDAINAVVIRSDFKRKYAVSHLAESSRYEQSENLPYLLPMRGIALACAFDGSGYLGPYFEKSNIFMQVSVNAEKKIMVHAYPPSNAIREIWTKIITENLEVEKRNIIFTNEIIEENEKKDKVMIPDTLVGTVSIKTILLKKCVDSIKRKKLENAPFSVKKNLPTSRKKAWNQEEFSGSPYYNTAFGTCTVELDFDEYTFREKLRKICVIIDGGKILNPKAAENAVYRSIQRCLTTLVDDDSLKCNAISVQFMQSEDEPKQIGHLIYSILPAAYTAALSQAIAAPVTELPLQTDSLYKIYEEAKISKKQNEEGKK